MILALGINFIFGPGHTRVTHIIQWKAEYKISIWEKNEILQKS
jgi:hypothetical protein